MDNKEKERTNSLVGYSRAGDTFHYRWAAVRCLDMISFQTVIEEIDVESSRERKAAGEYVIDLTEYRKDNSIIYYQMKHTTCRKDKNYTLSELSDTVAGFAKRYLVHKEKKDVENTRYALVTNRVVSKRFKVNIGKIANNEKVSAGFYNSILKHTGLTKKDLSQFCGLLQIMDGQGDYKEQWWNVYKRAENFIAGNYQNEAVRELTDLITNKVLPDEDGGIMKEDVLKCFHVTSEEDLFPARSSLQLKEHFIERKQYQTIANDIWKESTPVIVHAEGGVGKSVFSQSIKRYLRQEDIAIVYDSFGDGTYRNRSRVRHTHRVAFQQIINELAQMGLCETLIITGRETETDITKTFLNRIESAIQNLTEVNKDAHLLLVIDAADNAEMAAEDFKDTCFAHELLREKLPEGCWLLMTCRTERLSLLNAPSYVRKYQLEKFDEEETCLFFQKNFGKIDKTLATVFWKYAGGNPRILSYASTFANGDIEKLQLFLTPNTGTTVDTQIQTQIELALKRLKDSYPGVYQDKTEQICRGLAVLPPSIPVNVLSVAAGIQKEEILSFISELGRALWCDGYTVRFRDEPVETWFRANYSNSKEDILKYIEHIRRMEENKPYIAEAIPILLLNAGEYEQLIQYVLEDDTYAKISKGQDKHIREFQLHTAFKAALLTKNKINLAKIAILAGEIQAEASRQDALIKENIDLLSLVQSNAERYDLSIGKRLRGLWDGSEYVYKSALLRDIPGGAEEAKVYLESALHWEELNLEEQERDGVYSRIAQITDKERLELAYTYYKLCGAQIVVKGYLDLWTSGQYRFQLYSLFIRRLLDWGDESGVYEIEKSANKDSYAVFAICNELLKIGKLIPKDIIENLLVEKEKNFCIRVLKEPSTYEDRETVLSGVLSFLESCVAYEIVNQDILDFAVGVLPEKANLLFKEFTGRVQREEFCRAYVLREKLGLKIEPELFQEKENDDIKKCKETFEVVVPWYKLRLQCLIGNVDLTICQIEEINKEVDNVLSHRYMKYDFLLSDKCRYVAQLLIAAYRQKKDIQEYLLHMLMVQESGFRIDDKIELLYTLKRNNVKLSISLEENICNVLEKIKSGAERVADDYALLARSVISDSKDDAAFYFNMALKSVNVMEEELVERWESIASLGERTAQKYHQLHNLANEFICCAEYIGDSVAREKYWSRHDAIRICTCLSPIEGIKAMSRWREQQIGFDEEQVEVLAQCLVKEKFLPSEYTWCLHSFMDVPGVKEFANLCENECDRKEAKQIIHEQAQFINQSCMLQTVPFVYENKKSAEKSQPDKMTYEEMYVYLNEKINEQPEGMKIAFEELSDHKRYYINNKVFWQAIVNIYTYAKYKKLLSELLENIDLKFYDMREVLKVIKKEWYGRASFTEYWSTFLFNISKKYYLRLINSYARKDFYENISSNENEQRAIREGIIEGVRDSNAAINEMEYFSFVALLAEEIEPEEAKAILGYSLNKLEQLIPDKYLLDKVQYKEEKYFDIKTALAKYIWVALGSPERQVRWNAVHAIINLCKLECGDIIDLMIKEDLSPDIEEYLHKGFVMYSYNAKLYLVTALRRCVLEFPEVIVPFTDYFYRCCFEDNPHILIQLYAKETALELSKSYPGCYDSETLEKISKVMISPYEKRKYEYIRSEKPTIGRFYHGYDFEVYWFKPLGELFGLSGNEIEALVTSVICDEWKIKYDGGYASDPRKELYEKYNNMQKTYHSHYSYPMLEQYNFYLSYHALMVVAARLLKERSVREDKYEENPLNNWLAPYRLLDDKGCLKADYRDVIPKDINDNCNEKITDGWINDYENLFAKKVFIENEFICLSGYWTEIIEYTGREEISISSAIVLKEEAEKLKKFLLKSEPYDYALPAVDDNYYREEIPGCDLEGIVGTIDVMSDLSQYDLWAGEVNQSRYLLNEQYFDKIDMTLLKVQNWSFPYENRREDINAVGHRLLIPVSELSKLIPQDDKMLVVKVLIEKDFINRYDNKNQEYQMPKMDILLIDKDGKMY